MFENLPDQNACSLNKRTYIIWMRKICLKKTKIVLSQTKEIDSIFNSLITSRPCTVKKWKGNCIGYVNFWNTNCSDKPSCTNNILKYSGHIQKVTPKTQNFSWDMRPEIQNPYYIWHWRPKAWDPCERWDPRLKRIISCRTWDLRTIIQMNFNQMSQK